MLTAVIHLRTETWHLVQRSTAQHSTALNRLIILCLTLLLKIRLLNIFIPTKYSGRNFKYVHNYQQVIKKLNQERNTDKILHPISGRVIKSRKAKRNVNQMLYC